MEHRADNFFQLAEHLLDTYLGATRDVFATKETLDKSDIDRIIGIMREYTPKLAHVFTNLCTHCPAYTIAHQIVPETAPMDEAEIVDFARQSVAFVATLLSRYDPSTACVRLLDLQTVIPDYRTLSRGGQRVLDQRVRKSLLDHPALYSALLYLGGGCFVLLFLETKPDACQPSLDAVVDHVLKLTGRDSHTGQHRKDPDGASPTGPNSAGAAAAAAARKENEAELLQRLRDRFAAAVGDPSALRDRSVPTDADFDPIRAQITLTYVPIWDARNSSTTLSLVWPRRSFPDGSRLSGYRLLARGRLDPFHNALQLHLLEGAVEAVQLQAASALQPRLCPAVIVGFSLAGLICADLEALEESVANALAGYAGGKVILWLQDIEEHIPYRSLVRLLGFFRKQGLRWVTDLPLKHAYWKVCTEDALPIAVRDAEAFAALGLDRDSALLLARHVCKKVATQGVDCLMLNIDTSPWAEAVLHGGGRYLSGKIAGEATHHPGTIIDLPASRVLMKV